MILKMFYSQTDLDIEQGHKRDIKEKLPISINSNPQLNVSRILRSVQNPICCMLLWKASCFDLSLSLKVLVDTFDETKAIKGFSFQKKKNEGIFLDTYITDIISL